MLTLSSDEVGLLAANVEKCQEYEKYTAMIFDEMYIKEDLVYNKHLVGLANLLTITF